MDCTSSDSLPDYDTEIRSLLSYRLAQFPDLGKAAVFQLRKFLNCNDILPQEGFMSVRLQQVSTDSSQVVPVLHLDYFAEPRICWSDNLNTLDALSQLADEWFNISRVVVTSPKGTYRNFKEDGRWILEILVGGEV